MKTKSYNVYKFNELSEPSKQKAIENLCNMNTDYDWWDSVYDDAKTIGLKITGFDLDRGAYYSGDFIESAKETAELIIKNHGDTCATYLDAKKYLADYVNLGPGLETYDDVSDALDKLNAEFLKTICEDYRIILQKEYEYLTSEEAIVETILLNDYDFTEDGKID